MTYDEAFKRLEEILETMNKPQATLETSLKLYEEADKLLRLCGEKLSTAEQRIETLIRTREGGFTKEPL